MRRAVLCVGRHPTRTQKRKKLPMKHARMKEKGMRAKSDKRQQQTQQKAKIEMSEEAQVMLDKKAEREEGKSGKAKRRLMIV
jgi:hypothetical protein